MNTNYSTKTDLEIWKDFKAGSREAYAYIYRTHYKSLYNYGNKISSNSELVKDAIHDLFIELWKCKERLADTDSIKFYFYRSIRRKIVNELKSINKFTTDEELLLDYNFELILSPESNLISHQINEEQKENLLKAISTLTKRQKEAIFLRYYEDLSYQEVAYIMSLTINSTYVLISKAIDVLKKTVERIYFLIILFNNL
jgi:RNA polymerase sigma factor (sigma-70 family)